MEGCSVSTTATKLHSWTCMALIGLGLAASPPVFAAKVVLRVSHAWPATRSLDQAVFDKWFMGRHPNITVKSDNSNWMTYREKMLTRIASGAVPDVMYSLDSWTQIWMKAGVLRDLMPFIKQTKDFNLADFTVENLRKYKQGSKLFAIPFDMTPLPFYYNRTLFSQAGLVYPKLDAWTMEKLREFCGKLTKDKNGDGKADQFGISFMQWGINWTDSFFRPWGASVMSKDEQTMAVDSTKAIDAMQFWTDLIQKDKVFGGGFEQGKVGVAWLWNTGDVGYLSTSSKGKWEFDVGHLPKGPEARVVMAASSGYGISTTSKHPQEAWTYLNDYMSIEGQHIMRESFGVPLSRKSARTPEYPGAPKDFSFNVIFDMLDDYAQSTVSSAAIEYVYPIITREFGLMFGGKKSVADAMKRIKAEGDIQLRIHKLK